MKAAQKIKESLEKNPEDWKEGEFYLTNGEHRIWVANGFWFLSLGNSTARYRFSFFEKIAVMRAITMWRRNRIVASLSA